MLPSALYILALGKNSSITSDDVVTHPGIQWDWITKVEVNMITVVNRYKVPWEGRVTSCPIFCDGHPRVHD